jgi:hypothetical protein
MKPIRYKNYEIGLSPVSGKYTLSKLGVAVNKVTGENYESIRPISYDLPFDYIIRRIIENEANEKENETLQDLILSYKDILIDVKNYFSNFKTA